MMRAIAIAGSALTLALLAALHVLSPQFDPSWRVVSEYADGPYAFVLSTMFAVWAVSTWALAFALRPYVRTRTAMAGWYCLIIAGIGEALAAVFDINQPVHALAGILGAGGLPVAAMLLSSSLRHAQPWWVLRKRLWVVANLTWVAVLAMGAGVTLLFVTYLHAGGAIPANGGSLPIGTVLPAGTIALAGYANRLMIIVNCVWVMLAAWPLRTSVPARYSVLSRTGNLAEFG